MGAFGALLVWAFWPLSSVLVVVPVIYLVKWRVERAVFRRRQFKRMVIMQRWRRQQAEQEIRWAAAETTQAMVRLVERSSHVQAR